MKTWQKFVIKQLKQIIIVGLIGVFVSTLFAGIGLWSSSRVLTNVFVYSVVLGFSLWKTNELSSYLVERYNPWTVLPKKTLRLDLISSITVSSVVIFLVNYLLFPSLYGYSIFKNPRLFFLIATIQLTIAIIITGTFYVREFYSFWIKSSLNEEKLKREALILQYEALKSNVNPHFLFNSLSVLSSLIDTDSKKAKQFIQKFSDIYRYVLEQKDKEVVAVEDEIIFIKSFINLHQIRHELGLNISIEVEDLGGYIVPLSLQILLENCFKHNIISEEKPLTVKVWREDDFILVQNNLQKRRVVQESSGVGLDTIIRRYEYLTEKKVIIEQDEKHYLVKIPILQDVGKEKC